MLKIVFDINVFHHRRTCVCFHLLFFSKNIVLFIFMIMLIKEICTCFVLGRKLSPCFEVLIPPNWVVRSRQLGKLTVLKPH